MHRRPTPLPAAMQGRWLDPDDGSEIVISGFDVFYQGKPVRHDRFSVSEDDGTLAVDLGIDDPTLDDAFQRENVTGLIMDSDGRFHAFNVRFGASFEKIA